MVKMSMVNFWGLAIELIFGYSEFSPFLKIYLLATSLDQLDETFLRILIFGLSNAREFRIINRINFIWSGSKDIPPGSHTVLQNNSQQFIGLSPFAFRAKMPLDPWRCAVFAFRRKMSTMEMWIDFLSAIAFDAMLGWGWKLDELKVKLNCLHNG